MKALVDQVNMGKFIDPKEDPSKLIEQLEKISEEVSAVHSRLLGLSKWKEAITGVFHDLTNVNRCETCTKLIISSHTLFHSLLDQVYVRQELWKYRRVFDGYEKRWMNTPFKKLEIEVVVATKVR